MTQSASQSMLERLRKSMAMSSLSTHEQAQCEQKLALTEKLDHILFTEWDPIGVHLMDDFDCEGEYHCYLPAIVDMVINGASIVEIADTLYAFEDAIVGEYLKCRRRCYEAAARILDLNPAYDQQQIASQSSQCEACRGYRGLPPKAHCIDHPGYGAKLDVHYVD